VTSEADEEAEENAAGKFLRAEVIFDRCRVPIANDTMIKRPKAHVDTMIHFRLCFGCEASEIFLDQFKPLLCHDISFSNDDA
jgi:hypothetical protein